MAIITSQKNRTSLAEEVDNSLVALPLCPECCTRAVFVPLGYVCILLLHEVLHDIHVALGGGVVQSRPAISDSKTL